MEKALKLFRYQDNILLGELSTDIGISQNPRSQNVADLMIEFRLMDLPHHLCKSSWLRHLKTGLQVIQSKVIWESSEYILGIDRRFFGIARIRATRNYPSDNPVLRA